MALLISFQFKNYKMKNFLSKYKKILCVSLSFAVLLTSCTYKEIIEANVTYPDQNIYMAQASVAVLGPSGNGIYAITPAVYNQAQRFSVDKAAAKVNIPLGIIRSGVSLSGIASINIAVNTDTIAKLITSGKLVAGTEVLPATSYTLPQSVTIDDGSGNVSFLLALDLNFLTTNINKKYAIAVGITSATNKVVKSSLSTTVIYIDPTQLLLPIANFTNYVLNYNKSAVFLNSSANAVSYSWNYGDGTPAETTLAPTHVYAASGTYTVTLTATGITGSAAATVKTAIVIIP